MWFLKVLSPIALWPFFTFSTMSGSPAIARKVGQPIVVLDDLVRDRCRPGSCRASAPASGMRNAPSQLVFFSLRNGVIPASGQVFSAARCRSNTSRRCRRRCRVRRAGRASSRRSCRGRSSCRGRATASARPDRGSLSWCACGKCMCVVLSQTKNGLPALCLRLMKSVACGDELVVAGLHPLPRQRAGVLDLLLADLAPARHLRRVVLVRRPRVDHAARTEPLA